MRLTESRKGLARLDTNFHEAVRQLCDNHLRVDEDGFAVGAQSRTTGNTILCASVGKDCLQAI